MNVDADVAIVGYGPVGNVLAILLAQLGRAVTVLERWSAPYLLPRAVHFDHEVGRILQSCGIGDELRTISEPAGHLRVAQRRRGGRCCGSARPATAHPGGPRRRCSTSRSSSGCSTAVPTSSASTSGVASRSRASSNGDEGVIVTGADGTRVSARFVVGCDGANSTVRDD